MKRWFVVALVSAAMALVPITAAADEGHGDGHAKHFGPFKSSSTDSGTCGPDWANDTFKREFSVSQSSSGVWEVTEDFKDGHFVTIDSASPGACETALPHGALVTAGIKGEFHGFLFGTVTGGTFDAKGCKAETADCSTTAGFIAATFGPTAVYDTPTFFFTYRAHGDHDTDLIYRHWVNASDDQGGNRGDIATS
jgi:hypothetical protein